MQEELIELFLEYKDQQHFSGVALIKQGEEDLFSYAAGEAHKGFQIPNTLDTRFDTASITKLFTAAGIVLLESRNRISFRSAI